MEAASLVVELHNEYRKKHGVPPVELDLRLCDQAFAYASALAHGQRTDEPDSSIGRNIFQTRIAGSSRNKRAIDPMEVVREAIDTWYGHVIHYNWDCPLASEGHARSFSQIVWKESALIGFGLATRGVVTMAVVLYLPVGNVQSNESYQENVFKCKDN